MNTLTVTILIDNYADANLNSEHGLSLWLDFGEKRVLFDTGQTNMILKNAELLGIDLSCTDAIVLSHGHYDHTGGLPSVLKIAHNAKIYLHPAATESKFSQKPSGMKLVGMPTSAKEFLKNHQTIWTATPTLIFPGISVTGQVPRTNDFEDTGGAFFLDEDAQKPDELLDDQTVFIESAKGLIVIFGCAHSGVVNILDYISGLTGKNKIYAVIGGMHLLNASQTRITNTIEVFKKYNIQKIVPLHCTGQNVAEEMKKVFGEKYIHAGAGAKMVF
ncbi:MAG: MBL fold metallo-hydrolase [Phycisphaerae bacterium]|jgi:7,8-dihydropterin-6-yl-methyl-4-(beta-D-ribofuranosyl)aminobenzene 5'-phosphate synthase